MKLRIFLICIMIIFLAETSALIWYGNSNTESALNAVEVNEAVKTVLKDWDNLRNHHNSTTLDYVVLDNDGSPVFATKRGLCESINAAIVHRDTILDLEKDGRVYGKIIIYNDSPKTLLENQKKYAAVPILAAALQCICLVIYTLYLNHRILKPFARLKAFAERVAGGNLDLPLTMDRDNIFGAFTESFDLMRSELQKARLAEARANAGKKELAAKLSHDIRTPVASIKAASEVGAAVAENEKSRQNYTHIIRKADQINTLVTNLLSATLEELQQLTVKPSDMQSGEISEMLTDADYFHYARIPSVPDCLIYADKLRLQQVFDNIFSNSYKYADTEINVDISLHETFLCIRIEDLGGGVPDEEIPFLKEKFKRGQNAGNVEGAGLGLYISDCFMREMGGALIMENGSRGLMAVVRIPLSGTI